MIRALARISRPSATPALARFYASSAAAPAAAASSLLNSPPLSPGALAQFLAAAQSRLAMPTPASIVVLGSAAQAAALVAFAESYAGRPSLVVAAVDGVPLGAQRAGVSALFLRDPVQLEDGMALPSPEEQQQQALGKPSARGVRTARNPWTLDHGVLAVRMAPADAALMSTDLAVQLASTLFETGSPTTLMYVPGASEAATEPGQRLARRLLTSAQIRVGGLGGGVLAQACAPLRDLSAGQTHAVTDAKSNMVKTIDGKAAAGFLERSVALMEPHQDAAAPVHVPERKVFALVGTPGKRYEVIAGGGGVWSARSRMLVLDPGAAPRRGDAISFALAEPGMLFDEPRYAAYLADNGVELQPKESHKLRLMLECAPVIEDLEDLHGRSGLLDVPPATVVDNLFGASCENGFLVGSSKHSVPGELIELQFSK